MAVTAEQLGLPADRAWIEAPRAGAYPAGATLEFVAGIRHGVAAPRRTFALELCAPDGVAVRQELTRTVLRPAEPIVLSLRLPTATGVQYELVLRAGEHTIAWPVRVPGLPLDARWEAETPLVRRGGRVGTVLYTGEFELLTGADYRVERWDGRAWHDAPWAEEQVWAAVGLGIAAHSVTRKSFDLPEGLQPGRHRLAKRFTVDEYDIDHVTLYAEFIVE